MELSSRRARVLRKALEASAGLQRVKQPARGFGSALVPRRRGNGAFVKEDKTRAITATPAMLLLPTTAHRGCQTASLLFSSGGQPRLSAR